MKNNIGTTDRMIRIILGVAVVGLSVYFQTWWGLLALIPLATATINFCPAYAILGIRTCSTNAE